MAPKPGQGLRQSRLPFVPGAENGRVQLAPDVVAHMAEQRAAEERQRQEEQAARDGCADEH